MITVEGNAGMTKHRRYKLSDKLPCDVHLPPRTIIRKGCTIETLMIALSLREEWPKENAVFPAASILDRGVLS